VGEDNSEVDCRVHGVDLS